MAFLLSEGAEPIPGYRLIRRLGTGGYGEVWQTTAPGGLTKAIKVIFGHMRDARAEQELRALSRIKEVRHPFLLSLERYEIIEDQLFIVTEVADGSLMDRFEECRRLGLSGIPREELQAYMRDTADALDYMNEHYGLQHLDIKPQNLLLVAGRIKIADFGLVKDMHGTSATATGGVTPLYASPEAFDGKISRFSDQYSLAIVYQEMLTGLRPFPGRTTLQLAAQHMNSPPLLDPLPVADRPVIGRALAKVPDQRFPTCREMVTQLLKAAVDTPAPPAALGKPGTNGSRRADAPPAHFPDGDDPDDARLLVMDTLIAAEMPRLTPPSRPRPKPKVRPPVVPPQQFAGTVRLRPTLFVGVGGLAGSALRGLRQRLHRQFGDLEQVPIFRLLHIDTDRAGLWPPESASAGAMLTPDETLLTPLRRPDHYRAHSKELMRWLDRRWLYGIPRSLLTGGLRPFGRLALIDNMGEVLERLRDALALISSEEAQVASAAATGLALREQAPRVFLVASISGGTGSGMALDLAYAIRQVLAEQQLPAKGLCGLLLHATSDDPTKRDLGRVNAYAALAELNHYSRPGTFYPGDPRRGLKPAPPGTQAFEEIYLVHLGDQLGDAEAKAGTDALAEYLYLDAATEAGAILDQYRSSTHATPQDADDATLLRTFGLDRLHFPKQALIERAASLLCRELVNRWQRSDAPRPDASVKDEALGQAATLDLEAAALANRVYSALQLHWAADPEEHLQGAVSRWLAAATPVKQAPADSAAHVVQHIEQELGSGAGQGQTRPPTLTPLETTLHKLAGAQGGQRGAEARDWLIKLVNDPGRRLVAAEQAARALVEHVGQAIDNTRAHLAECQAERLALRKRLLAGEPVGKPTSARLLGIGQRKRVGGAAEQKFLEYCWLRLCELVLDATLEALRAASRPLGEFAQELSLVREKASHFGDRFGPDLATSSTSRPADTARPGVTTLVPYGAADVHQAAEELLHHLGTEAGGPRSVDEPFEKEIFRPRGGLWAVLSDPDSADGLAADLQKHARRLVGDAVKGIDAAKLFLETYSDPATLQNEVRAHVRAATPHVLTPEAWKQLIVAAPPGPAGERLRGTVSALESEQTATFFPSDVDVVIGCEAARLPLPQVASALIEGESTYADLSRKVLTRIDVNWPTLPVQPLDE